MTCMDWHRVDILGLKQIIKNLLKPAAKRKANIMDSKNIKRVNMIDATTDFCDLNTAATSGITNFALRLADVKAKRVLIDGMNQLGGANTTGVTIDVNVLKGLMISKAFKCGSATLGFANFTNNNTLRTLVKFTKRQLGKLPNESVDDVCQQIHDATDANLAGATPYGIVASDVTDLQAAIDLFRARNGDTRQAIISRSQANEQARTMIREVIDELLEGQLDVMVNTVEETQAAFWSGYFQARQIIDSGTFSTVLKILVVNEANNEPILSAKCYRDNSPDFKKSSKLGFVTFKDIEEGAHSFVLKHKLFEDLTIPSVMISHGKRHNATAKMKPIIPEGGSGDSIMREYDIPASGLVDFDITGVNGTTASEAIIEVTGPAGVRLGAVANPGDIPGPTHYDKETGSVTMTLDQFKTLIGYSAVNQYLTAQNIGMVATHIKITFTNLEA